MLESYAQPSRQMHEIIRMNEELLRENALHVSTQRMKELFHVDKPAYRT